MVTKKHPKRIPVISDYTYELGPKRAFDRAKAITPDGMKYDSVFWEMTDVLGDNGKPIKVLRRAVGIYKVKGKSDVQLYLDTAEIRTRRAPTAKVYMRLSPGEPGSVSPPYRGKPIPENASIKERLKIHGKRKATGGAYHYLWNAVRTNDKAVLAEAKKQGLEIPTYTPYEKVIERLLREGDAAIMLSAKRGNKDVRRIAEKIGVKVPKIAVKKKGQSVA